MSINRGRKTTTEGLHASLVGILSFLLFLSWWRALKRRSNHPETVWIPLEARHFNSFKNSFKETCKYVFSFILDDRIICSWWLGILNVRFNFFTLHLMFWSKFQKVIDLRSHQEEHPLGLVIGIHYETFFLWHCHLSQFGMFKLQDALPWVTLSPFDCKLCEFGNTYCATFFTLSYLK